MNKVLPGQMLKIPASTFNTMVDAASDYQRRKLNRTADPLRPNALSGIITIRNSSGVDCERFSVLGIAGVVVTADDNRSEFLNRYCIDAVLPTAEHDGKFVVLQEPIKSGAFGKAMIVGTTPVLIQGDSASNAKTAGLQAGQTYLVPNVGGAQILWEQPTTGSQLHLALVRFPASSGGTGNVTVRYATTVNLVYSSYTATSLTFSSAPSVDGATPAVDTLVLVKNQTIARQNGIYRVGTGNVWTREGDIKSGMLVSVRDGSLNSGSVWVLRTNDPITVGTTSLTFANRAWNEYVSVKAAATSKVTTTDGQTLSSGDRLLVTTGADVGVWEFLGGTNWNFLEKSLVVGVRLGIANGLQMWFLNSTATAYSRQQYGYISVKAADVAKATTMDGVGIASGDNVVVVSGAEVGVWQYQSSGWTFIDKPAVVGVRLGGGYGLLTLFLNSANNAYAKGQAVYA